METNAKGEFNKILMPESFLACVRPAEKPCNSMYKCLKCPLGFNSKPLPCSDAFRQNLKKHIQVNKNKNCYNKFNR